MQTPSFFRINTTAKPNNYIFNLIQEVALLEQECFSSPWTAEQFLDCLTGKHYHLYVLRFNKRIIAYALFNVFEDEAELLNIALLPQYRKQGFATYFLENIFQKTSLQFAQIFLEVRTKNTPARKLYEKFQFSPQGIRKNYYQDDGDDALIMIRNRPE